MKKFAKDTLTLLLTAAMLAGVTACGAKDATGVDAVDLDELAKTILDQGNFTDDLAEIDDATIMTLYGIDNATEQVVYIGSGATPEEIALFSFATEADAEAGFALAQMRIADQKNEFSDYNAWEMPKLEDAVVKQYGTVVALCVSGDDAAEAVLAENLEK